MFTTNQTVTKKGNIHNDILKSYNKHIIIAGSARSGTSWLAEIIALQFRYRLLFEPEKTIDDSEAVNLTGHKSGDFNPAFSPDGKQIAFSSDS